MYVTNKHMHMRLAQGWLLHVNCEEKEKQWKRPEKQTWRANYFHIEQKKKKPNHVVCVDV